MAGGIERAGVGIRAHPDEGSNIARYQTDGIERCSFYSGHTGVRAVTDAPIEPLIWVCALTKLGILALGGPLVQKRDCPAEALFIYTALRSKSSQCIGLLDVARGDMRSQSTRQRP